MEEEAGGPVSEFCSVTWEGTTTASFEHGGRATDKERGPREAGKIKKWRLLWGFLKELGPTTAGFWRLHADPLSGLHLSKFSPVC